MANELDVFAGASEESSFLSYFVNDWEISVEFAESKSDRLKKILTIAKSNSSFSQIFDVCSNADEGITKAFEIKFKANEFLEFRKLYDVVKNWKSTVVRISGQIVDKILIGKLGRCYTDKVKMKDFPTYCYGVSQFTFNPFGCHRTKIHSMGNNAWYHYVNEQNGKLIIDKKRMLIDIANNIKDYRLCPVLNPKEIFSNFLKLPNEIHTNDDNWVISRNSNGSIQIQSREEVQFRKSMIDAAMGKV